VPETKIAKAIERPTLKALHVTLENKPGTLAMVTKALADNKINIEAVEAEILGKSAFFRFFTETPAEAERVIRALKFVTVGMEVIEVIVPNQPGELARICDMLSKAGINIESLFGSSGTVTRQEARFYFRVDRPEQAAKILTAAKFAVRRTLR
jgi:hypothetical protein